MGVKGIFRRSNPSSMDICDPVGNISDSLGIISDSLGNMHLNSLLILLNA